jgi:hypothetical protein
MVAYLTISLRSLECGKANWTDARTIEHGGTGSEITHIPALASPNTRVTTRQRNHHACILRAAASAHHGVHGNGHGLIYKKNSDEALKPVIA